jgi:hypothetical protein
MFISDTLSPDLVDEIVGKVIEAELADIEKRYLGEGERSRPYVEGKRELFARYIRDWFDAGRAEPTIEEALKQCRIGWQLDDVWFDADAEGDAGPRPTGSGRPEDQTEQIEQWRELEE